MAEGQPARIHQAQDLRNSPKGGGNAPGHVVIAVVNALAEHGPMTRAEIQEATGLSADLVYPVVTRLNRKAKTVPKRIYKIRYTQDDSTENRRMLKAVYALGDKKDASKPSKEERAARQRLTQARWREAERNRVNSVFAWAQPRSVRQAQRKAASVASRTR